MQMAVTAPVLEGEQNPQARPDVRQLEQLGDAFSIRANLFRHPKLRRLSFVYAHLILQADVEARQTAERRNGTRTSRLL